MDSDLRIESVCVCERMHMETEDNLQCFSLVTVHFGLELAELPKLAKEP